MPKPLSSFPFVDGYEYGRSVMRQHLDINSLISEILFAVSSFDPYRINVLCLATGDDVEAALALYEMVKSQRDRGKALLEVAKLGLSKEQAAVLKQIEVLAATATASRNLFAHQVWGFAEKLPDCLLLLPPHAEFQNVVRTELGNLLLPSGHDKIQVFNREELNEMAIGAWACVDYFHQFCWYLETIRRQSSYEGLHAATGQEHLKEVNASLMEAASAIWKRLLEL